MVTPAMKNPIWANLSAKAISRYRDLEKRTGINFYHDVGLMRSGKLESDYVESFLNVITTRCVHVEEYIGTAAQQKFPYLKISSDDMYILEPSKSGYINPRKMLTAQQTAAHLQGCQIIDDVVDEVNSVAHAGTSFQRIKTGGGQAILAKKVLVATGAFTSFRHLLPSGINPDVELAGQVVVFGEISEKEADKLKDMPSILHMGSNLWGDGGPGSEDVAQCVKGVYILPPIKYPNGKFYIKMGHYSGKDPVISEDEASVKRFYCDPAPKHINEALQRVMKNIFQGFQFISIEADTCVTTDTRTNVIYIDMVTDKMGVAIGGCGCAAASSDEIGRIAVHMILHEKWVGDFQKDNFRFLHKNIQGHEAKM